MTPEQLAAIKQRLTAYWGNGENPNQIADDAEALLAEVERLQSEVEFLTDELRLAPGDI